MRVINAIVYPTFEQQQEAGFVHLSQRHLYPQDYTEDEVTGKRNYFIPEGSKPDWTLIAATLDQLDPDYEGIILIDIESWPLRNVESDPSVQADFASIVSAVGIACPKARTGLYNVDMPTLVGMCDILTIPLYVWENDTRESYVARCKSVMANGATLGRPQCPLVMPRTKAGWMISMDDWADLRRLLARLGASAMLVWGQDKDRALFEPYCTP